MRGKGHHVRTQCSKNPLGNGLGDWLINIVNGGWTYIKVVSLRPLERRSMSIVTDWVVGNLLWSGLFAAEEPRQVIPSADLEVDRLATIITWVMQTYFAMQNF